MERFEPIGDDDLPDGLYRWYLKASGLWGIINHCRKTGHRSPVLIAWMAVIIIMYSPLLVSSIVALYMAEKNLEGITLVVLNPITALQAVIKFAILWTSVLTHARILELMKKNYISVVPPHQKQKAMEVLHNSVKEANILVGICLIASTSTVIVWNLLPILRSEYVRLSLGITLFGEPVSGDNRIFKFWYPVDTQVTPWGEIIYVYEFIVCCWTAFMIIIMECLVAQLILLLTGHLKVFQFSLSELKFTTTQSKLQLADLLVYIKEHQKLMKVGNEILSLYDFLITVSLASGLGVLIIAIFNFFLGTGKGDLVEMFKYISFALYELVEVSIYCFAGTRLETTSEEVCFAAYSCDWHAMEPEFRRNLQMIMLRSRRTVTLRAAKHYPVNLQALTGILQFVYSTAMLMFRVTNNETI